ncbi:MAG TPA: hypothetical protein PKJ98_04765 [Verrucomicrobiota bacterium]|nr:hypothetical protein [Verrucomicrobiota bacterium]
MIGLPVFARELQRAQRRQRTYWLRLAAAVAAVGVCWGYTDTLQSYTMAGSVGRTMFFLLGGAMYALALVSGLFLTAPSLREEKETRILELLLLTPLRPHHLLFGKLAARSLQSLQMVFAALPVLAVPVVVGGVSFTEFTRMATLLLTTMFLSLVIGLWAAAVWTHARSAMFGALVALSGLTIAWLGVDQGLLSLAGLGGLESCLLPGPLQALFLVSELDSAQATSTFGQSLVFTAAVVVALFWLTCRQLPRACTEQALGDWRTRGRNTVTVTDGEIRERRQSRRRALRHNPGFWLAWKRRGSAWQSAAMVLTVTALWVGAWVQFGGPHPEGRFLALLGLPALLHGLLKVMAAGRTASSLAFLRNSGELELLLVTGLSTRRLVRGLRQARLREMRVPILLVALVDAGVVLVGQRALDPQDQAELWLCLWLFIVMLGVDLFVLLRVGLWQGLVRPNVLQAVTASVLMILVWPWLLFAMTVGFAPTVYLYGLVLDEPLGWFLGAATWWWAIGFANNAVYYFRARNQLRDNLRELVSSAPCPLGHGLLAGVGRFAAPSPSRVDRRVVERCA